MHAATVVGIDQSAVQITAVGRLFRRRTSEGSGDVRQGDATMLPWSGGTLSVVTCNCRDCFGAGRSQGALKRRSTGCLAGRSSSVFRSTTTPPKARQAEQGAGDNTLFSPDLTALLDKAGFTETDNTFAQGSMRFAHATVPSDHPSTLPSVTGMPCPA